MGTPSGVPTQKVVNMRYCATQAITGTLGALGTYVFSANSIYDPDVTGIGHQPMGHDTMATLYNHYVVLGSRVRVDWGQNSANSGTQDTVVGCLLNDDSTTGHSSFESILESRKGTYKFLTTGRNSQSTYSKFSAKKFFNVKDVKDNLDRIGGTFGTTVGDNALYILWAQARDGASTITANFTITIDYIVLCSEPKDLTQS